MKLVYFIIIVIIVYLIASKIKVMHIDTLPTKEAQDIKKKAEIRTILLSSLTKNKSNTMLTESFTPNTIEYDAQARSKKIFTNHTHKQKESGTNEMQLINTISKNFLNTNYAFNVANNPVTTRYYYNTHNAELDDIYIKYALLDINNWNEFIAPRSFSINDIKFICIIETQIEFIMRINVQLIYLGIDLYLRLDYYGSKKVNDDIFNTHTNHMDDLQLITIKQISKNDYNHIIYGTSSLNNAPFISFDNQLKYVEKMKWIREHENDI